QSSAPAACSALCRCNAAPVNGIRTGPAGSFEPLLPSAFFGLSFLSLPRLGLPILRRISSSAAPRMTMSTTTSSVVRLEEAWCAAACVGVGEGVGLGDGEAVVGLGGGGLVGAAWYLPWDSS